MGRKRETPEQKIIKHISLDAKTKCWNWTGVPNKDGYGRLTLNNKDERKDWLAHRYVYTYYIGKIKDNMTLDHLCRNRICVNPEHLEPVLIGVNLLRGNTFQAKNSQKISCKRSHMFNNKNTYYHKGHRHCRTCRRLRASGTI